MDTLVYLFQWLIVLGFIAFLLVCVADLFFGLSFLVYRFIEGPRRDARERTEVREQAFPLDRHDPTRPDENPLDNLWEGR
jgi:peptidoglycan/LPS O-acetylase OafA/YrhL